MEKCGTGPSRARRKCPCPYIVVLGAGLGGVMAYEMKEKMSSSDKLTVVNLGSVYSFVPSNPRVAVGWLNPEVGRNIVSISVTSTWTIELQMRLTLEGKIYFC